MPIKIDQYDGTAFTTAAEKARSAERDGYDGFWSSEINHDPFVTLTAACGSTTSIELGTSIAVAFARNPASVAMLANDLQLMSAGRFHLGLGSQVKAHITHRFGMPWSAPADRMREFIEAIRAIWASWETGDRPRFRGQFYTHTLMTPFFSPGPNPYGNPPIHVAAVGERMTKTAATAADGLLVHGFSTERFLREVTLPAVAAGRAEVGRDGEAFDLIWSPFVATGRDDAEIAAAVDATRKQIAFYGSTPSYLPVLDLHGWAGLHEKLNQLSKRGEWDEMGAAIDDEVLATFAAVGTPDEIAGQLVSRANLITRMSFYAPYPTPVELWTEPARQLRELVNNATTD